MKKALTALALSLTLPALAEACLWDYDTLAMEREEFPNTLEIITGKFLHHSKAFYEWRIVDRLKRLKESPDDLALLDDLAVAYEKTGQVKAGLEVLRRSEALNKDRYETMANLGTLLIHDRQLEEGLKYIKRAIEINPNAHFGREVYQQRLVEYVLSKKDDKGVLILPLSYSGRSKSRDFANFFKFLEIKKLEEANLAAKGVLGMLIFGNNNSPILLEALGDILTYGRIGKIGSNRLAARAYLRASYEAKSPEAKIQYREIARLALSDQMKGRGIKGVLKIKEVEVLFLKELAEAKAWRAELAAKEAGWIAIGIDVDAAYAKLYHKAPSIKKSKVRSR